MWPTKVKDEALVACGRRCCICHRFCGRNIELHHIVHESQGGDSTFENCIPLCFDCHAEAGHYNNNHPKGTKYSPQELSKHRERWYETMHSLSHLEKEWENDPQKTIPPNYESFKSDSVETYWMLVLPEPISLYANCNETGGTIKIQNVKKLQLCVDQSFYCENREIVRTDVMLKGKLFASITGHHHGDANFEICMQQELPFQK